MASESDLMRQIQLAATADGHRLFRNNVGQAELNGHVIRYGLCTGSSDLVGWTSSGQFLAVEVKRPSGRTTHEQAAFLHAARAAGCRAGVARSVADAKEIWGK